MLLIQRKTSEHPKGLTRQAARAVERMAAGLRDVRQRRGQTWLCPCRPCATDQRILLLHCTSDNRRNLFQIWPQYGGLGSNWKSSNDPRILHIRSRLSWHDTCNPDCSMRGDACLPSWFATRQEHPRSQLLQMIFEYAYALLRLGKTDCSRALALPTPKIDIRLVSLWVGQHSPWEDLSGPIEVGARGGCLGVPRSDCDL